MLYLLSDEDSATCVQAYNGQGRWVVDIGGPHRVKQVRVTSGSGPSQNCTILFECSLNSKSMLTQLAQFSRFAQLV